jgi:hypothetical protein
MVSCQIFSPSHDPLEMPITFNPIVSEFANSGANLLCRRITPVVVGSWGLTEGCVTHAFSLMPDEEQKGVIGRL